MTSPLDSLILASNVTDYNLTLNLTLAIAPAVLCVWGPEIDHNILGVITRSAEMLQQAQKNANGCLLLMKDRFSALPFLKKGPFSISEEACKTVQELQRKTFGLFSRFHGQAPYSKKPYSKNQFEEDRRINMASVERTLITEGIAKKVAKKVAKINENPPLRRTDARNCFQSEGLVSFYLNDMIAAPVDGQGLDPASIEHFHQSKKVFAKKNLPPAHLIKKSGEIKSPEDFPKTNGKAKVVLVVTQHLPPSNAQNDR